MFPLKVPRIDNICILICPLAETLIHTRNPGILVSEALYMMVKVEN